LGKLGAGNPKRQRVLGNPARLAPGPLKPRAKINVTYITDISTTPEYHQVKRANGCSRFIGFFSGVGISCATFALVCSF
jgi:hypothetical protein